MRAATILPFLALAAAATFWSCRPLPGDGVAAAAGPIDLANLAGRWRLIRIDRAAPPAGTEAPTLEIAADGAVAGSTAVNRYSTTLDRDALATGRVVLAPVAATKRGAAPDAMAAERRFLDRLAAAERLVLDGETLRLLDGAGEETLVFARESAPPR